MNTNTKASIYLNSVKSTTREDLQKIVYEIENYQTSIHHCPSQFELVEIIIHARSTLLPFAIAFEAICQELEINGPGEVDFNWEMGIFPFVKDNVIKNKRVNLYFIPILCKNGYQTMSPGDANYPSFVKDFKDSIVRDTYYKINRDFIYDLGNVYP